MGEFSLYPVSGLETMDDLNRLRCIKTMDLVASWSSSRKVHNEPRHSVHIKAMKPASAEGAHG